MNVITWCQCLLNGVGIWETSFGPGNTNNVMALNVSKAAQLRMLGNKFSKDKTLWKIPANPFKPLKDILFFILGNDKPQISPLISERSCGFWTSKGDSRCRFSGWLCSRGSSWSHWKVFYLLLSAGPLLSSFATAGTRASKQCFPLIFREKNWCSRMLLHLSCKTGMRLG